MKGDVLLLEEHHKRAARKIVSVILEEIKNKEQRYIITIAGESGSGKSETGMAVRDELAANQIKSILLGQDDYFILPPKSNAVRRREDSEWLGPHIEVKFDLLEQNLKDAICGKSEIVKPLVDYDNNSIGSEVIRLDGVKAVIVEGTYTSLLKHVDTRVFIARSFLDTLKHRQKRNRGNETSDPFLEQILAVEHKIIAGHKQLADFVITKDYDVDIVE